jgi:hypothetical protein
MDELLARSFTEADYDSLVDYVNFNATRAQFDGMTDEDVIKRYKLLLSIQKTILPKVQAHILELKEIKKAPPAKGSRSRSKK